MTGRALKRFLGKRVLVFGHTEDGNGQVLLGEGCVVSVEGGAVLLRSATRGPVSQAIDLGCVAVVQLAPRKPALVAAKVLPHSASSDGGRPPAA